MWVFTKPRNEYDVRFLLNLDLCSRVGINQLGERWFVEVTLGTETVPVASAGSQEEAAALMGRIFGAIEAGKQGLDLGRNEG